MTERTVSVSASGSVEAVPDLAHITTGVLTEASTAREAMAMNTQSMGKVIAGLKAAGIDSKDIRTTAINVNPRYSQTSSGKSPVINGYVAQNQVRITVRDLTRLGDLLDTSLTLGATQMSGIAFDVSQGETLRDDARKAGMVNARRRAELYATAAGANLGAVLAISEDAQSFGPQTFARGAVKSAAVPVEAGSIQLETTVHVTWALK